MGFEALLTGNYKDVKEFQLLAVFVFSIACQLVFNGWLSLQAIRLGDGSLFISTLGNCIGLIWYVHWTRFYVKHYYQWKKRQQNMKSYSSSDDDEPHFTSSVRPERVVATPAGQHGNFNRLMGPAANDV